MKLISKNAAKQSEILGSVEETSNEEIMGIVDLAHKAYDDWSLRSMSERITILRSVYDALSENSSKIAELITKEMGKPIGLAENEVKDTLKHILWGLDNAEKVLAPEITYEDDVQMQKVVYAPRGVSVVISPFNFPFSLSCDLAFKNMIVGNTVINKPDPNLPLLTELLDKIFRSTNLPKGVQQFVYGGREVGEFLVNQDINMICFTGNTQTGEHLYKVAAEKMIPILMELGGSAPGIVLEDADLDKVIKGMYGKKFSTMGQLCHALKRLIVHESLYDDVVNRLKDIAESQVIGDPMDRETTMGPLVNEAQLNKLMEQLEDAKLKGAKVVCGGNRPISGENYFEATIVTNVTRDMRIWNEEVFGPVLPIVSFKDEEEAIRLANDTIYGLGSYIYTTDEQKFERIGKRINTGMVGFNNVAYSAPYNPFGGTKRSGIGRTRGKWGLMYLCDIKTISYDKTI
ncbi:MAG: aldehyde dehydrogenase family protein [Bacilli bacterium]|nr:aldehyde dehydrogenase family protein [Bacilli bacterium]